jgi:hypothetical protein
MEQAKLSAKGKGPAKIADLKLRTADFEVTSTEPIRACSMILFLNPKFAIRNPKFPAVSRAFSLSCSLLHAIL